MVLIDIYDLEFSILSREVDGELLVDVICDSYIDEYLDCAMTLRDRVVYVQYQGDVVCVLADVTVKSDGIVQHVTVDVINKDQVLVEVQEILEEEI